MIFLISYFSGIKGSSTSEWADDKYYSLQEIYGSDNIKFFTSIKSSLSKNNIIKIPSLSWTDFNDEIKNIKFNYHLIFYKYFIYIFSKAYDYCLKFFIKGKSESRWSWFLTSAPVIFIYFIKFKPKFILTTGGAASAHLVGLILKFFFNFNLIVELQDPLVGESIGRNTNAQKYFLFIEKKLIKNSDKIIFVSKNAYLQCLNRYPKNKNLTYLYPGARKFNDINYSFNYSSNKIKFIHLGTLYGSRNMNLFLKAIDNLINSKKLNIEEIEVCNYGDIYCDELSAYKTRKYFYNISSINRKDALDKVKDYNCLLLIQHTDKRSNITIPFKLYDYLNFNIPIFGLINNSEIEKILSDDYFADNCSIKSIENSILNLKFDIYNTQFTARKIFIDNKIQVKKIFDD